MKHFRREHFSTLAGTLILSATLIGGCDSGTGGGSSSAPQTSGKAAHLTGVVMNQAGPISEGKIEVTDARGQQVASATLSGTSNKYSLTVPTGAAYPVVLTAKPTAGDSVKAVVTGPEAEMMDITTISTLVVDAAMQLGGLTPQNIARASGGAIGQRMSQGGGGGAGAGGAGGGPGNSSGGVSRGGGHAGHVMPEEKDQKPADASGTGSGMQHPNPSR